MFLIRVLLGIWMPASYHRCQLISRIISEVLMSLCNTTFSHHPSNRTCAHVIHDLESESLPHNMHHLIQLLNWYIKSLQILYHLSRFFLDYAFMLQRSFI